MITAKKSGSAPKVKATGSKVKINPIEIPSRAMVPVSPDETGGLEQLPELARGTTHTQELAIEALRSRFVLGTTKTGRLTGGVESIGQFCLRKTTSAQHPHGMAFNERHQAQMLKDRPEIGKLPVVSKELAKTLSTELDAVRKAYYGALKPVHIALHMRSDTEVRKLKLKETAMGITMTSVSVIKRPATSQEDTLRKQLAQAEAKLAALQKLVPVKLAKQAESSVTRADEKPIEVPATVIENPVDKPEDVAKAQPTVAAPKA